MGDVIMGKMSDLHLALQGIREQCNGAPSPRCQHTKVHKVLNDFENRICQILMYVKDIEDTLTGDAELPVEKARP